MIQDFAGPTNDVSGRPNLMVIDPVSGARSALLTGSGNVEVGYSPDSQQAFTTNYESNTVTVAALSPERKAFQPGQFVNITFQDSPSNLYVRHTGKGTDRCPCRCLRDHQDLER